MNLKEYKESHKGSKGVLVMDGDWLVFQSMSAAEEEVDWGDDVWTLTCDHKKALEILEFSIDKYKTRKKAWAKADIVLAFTDANNWRKGILDTYKANRKDKRKPVGFREFLSKVYNLYPSIKEDNLEGDDVMGIIASNSEAFGYQKAVIISCDKDFHTVPNCDFLWCTTGNIYSSTLESADRHHMLQTMKGDVADGYTGIRSIGEDTALSFLEEPYLYQLVEKELMSGKNKGQMKQSWEKLTVHDKTLWECMESIAAKNAMTPEELLVQARVARILRYEDYDIESKMIRLWEPKLVN